MVEIDDSPKNMMTCRKFCGTCPTFARHGLKNHPPQALFCARGRGSAFAATIARKECNCFNCDIFKANHMNFGFYCIQSGINK